MLAALTGVPDRGMGCLVEWRRRPRLGHVVGERSSEGPTAVPDPIFALGVLRRDVGCREFGVSVWHALTVLCDALLCQRRGVHLAVGNVRGCIWRKTRRSAH